MKPTYANQAFTNAQLDLFEEVRRKVEKLPDIGYEVSCHELARAVGLAFTLSWVDGHYLIGFEHSWVQLGDTDHIIDVYPIGHAGDRIRPVLVDHFVAHHLLGRGAYDRDFRLYDNTRLPAGLKNVRDYVVQTLREELKR